MSVRRNLVTGATGLLGSHIAERLIKRGESVRALVRPTSRTEFLRELGGVELVVGDLSDVDSCRIALKDVDVVYHTAAKVGDWGTWTEFQRDCLDATSNLGSAAAQVGVERFLHISSTSAYGHPREGGPPVDESAPLGLHPWPVWDYYTISKVECERILWRLAERERLRLSIIRPSWLYGERDRTTMPRLITKIRARGVPIIGKGDNPLSAIYAGNVAEAAILAVNDPGSVGEAYNITHQGAITQREFLYLLADACGAPRPWIRAHYPTVFAASFLFETAGRLVRSERPPLITRYAAWLMGRYLSYGTEKAERRLGWKPEPGYAETIERTALWWLDRSK